MNVKGIAEAIYGKAYDFGYKHGYRKALQDFIVLAKHEFRNDETAVLKFEQLEKQLKEE